MHLRSIDITGDFDTRRIRPWRYEAQRARFFKEYGVNLPTKKQAKKLGKLNRLIVLLNDLTIRVTTVDGVWWEWKLKRGFMCDGGSVPRIVWAVLSPYDVEFLAAYFVHDANYSGHYLQVGHGYKAEMEGLHRTNELLRAMAAYRKEKFRGWVAKQAVNSIIGQALYWKKPKQRAQTLDLIEFRASDGRYGKSISRTGVRGSAGNNYYAARDDRYRGGGGLD